MSETWGFYLTFETSLTDLKEAVIFNCAGYGAKVLNGDDNLYLVQGHLIMLQHQIPRDLQYMLIVNFELEETPYKKTFRTLDFFPEKWLHESEDQVGVLGGTFIESRDIFKSNKKEFDLILDRAKRFFYPNNGELER